MERINNRKYQITNDELGRLGATIEELLEKLETHEYGEYYLAEDLSLEKQLALRIITSMNDWQHKHNREITVFGDTNLKLVIEDIQEKQKRYDEAVLKLDEAILELK